MVGTGDAPLFEQIESALQPFWQGAHAGKGAADLRGWFASLAARAALTRTGAGLRQAQRKIKGLTGQSRRDLQLYARVEDAFVRRGRGERELAALATAAGYSDQSHLSREVKRVTGLPPKQFAERMQSDEAFWFYRLLDGYLHST
jgi:AraC-like DNA-binding protein